LLKYYGVRIKRFVIPVENNHLDEEVGDSKHQESSDEKVFEDEDISKRKEECKGENHGETDLHWDTYFNF